TALDLAGLEVVLLEQLADDRGQHEIAGPVAVVVVLAGRRRLPGAFIGGGRGRRGSGWSRRGSGRGGRGGRGLRGRRRLRDGRGCSTSGGGRVGDHGQPGADVDRLALLHEDLGHVAARWRRHLGVDLV